jgi:pimeloyl-ACP methyl ester carboxylesterase
VDGAGLRVTLRPASRYAQVVVPDQRGHGYSDLGTAEQWNLDQWADDLAAMIDVLGLEAPVVLGTSFGGWVAIRHAARYPTQACGVVIASMAARLPDTAAVAGRFRRLGGERAARAWLALNEDGTDEAAAEYERVCVPLMSVREPSRNLVRARRTRTLTPQVNRAFTAKFQLLDLRRDVASLTVPLLVMAGELDPLTTPESAAETAAASQSARLCIIPHASHELLSDAPEFVHNELRKFVMHNHDDHH